MATEKCNICLEYKPIESFWRDNNAAAHSFVRYECKECAKKMRREARSRRAGVALVGSGVSIHAGNGVRQPAAIVAPPGRTTVVEVMPAQERDMMSLSEWLSLHQQRSVFVTEHFAVLLLEHRPAEGDVLELLTTRGDGPGETISENMAQYLMTALTARQADSIVGVVYY